MTIRCGEAADERLTLYYYGELDEHERGAFERHLRLCQSCVPAFAELEAMRAALAHRGGAPPPADFTARLLSRIEAEGAAATTDETRSRTAWTWLPLAALLVIGIALGLVWERRTLGPAQPAAEQHAADAALDAAAERHFERAKLVVLGLAMKDPTRTGARDWEYERELAATLLPDTRLFRMAAADRGDARLADLLGDLETVLLQASMSAEPDAPELERIQRAIQRRDLLVRMQLIEG